METPSSVRRFVRSDGCWINIHAADGHLVQYIGAEKSTVPYSGGVEQENIKVEDGTSAEEQLQRLAGKIQDDGYREILPPEAATDASGIDALWTRFEIWLQHNTPAWCRWPLASGASDEELQALETTIGAQLPDDVRGSYLRHNGSNGVDLLAVVGEGRWVTLQEAAENWTFFQGIKDEMEEEYLDPPKGPMKKLTFSPGWIPISDNDGGDHLCIDLDPAEGGTVGQLFSYWHEYGAWRLVAPSMTAFLERLVNHLEQGRYAINHVGQLAPVEGPEPEQVDEVQEYFQQDA